MWALIAAQVYHWMGFKPVQRLSLQNKAFPKPFTLLTLITLVYRGSNYRGLDFIYFERLIWDYNGDIITQKPKKKKSRIHYMWFEKKAETSAEPKIAKNPLFYRLKRCCTGLKILC